VVWRHSVCTQAIWWKHCRPQRTVGLAAKKTETGAIHRVNTMRLCAHVDLAWTRIEGEGRS
jgi:hypothetical protein